jgi:phytoene desaturase
MKAAVIGSGVGGLAISIRLALKGYKVTVYEKNDRSGGKIAEIKSRGYRFDTGPSLLTLPELTDELFELAEKKRKDYFQYSRLQVICNYFFGDGLKIRAFSDPDQFAAELETKTGEPATRVLDHLKRSREQYNLTADIFLFNSLHKIRTFIHRRVLKGILMFHRVDAFTTMHQRNAKRFGDPRVTQLFDRYATYNGSNPFLAPATLNVISHLEHSLGAFFPSGGMRTLANSLELLARDSGVRFEFSRKVEKIIVDGKKAAGVMVKGEVMPYDLVVSDVDVNYLYQNLLPDSTSIRIDEKNLSSSALIFFWGIRGQFPSLEVHNILFSENYRNEFQHIFEKRSITSDPSVYIYITSKLVPSDAPDHCENWYVMINVPPDTGQDWELFVAEARQNIIRKINRILKIKVENLIEFEQIESPPTIEERTMSWKGALYGNHSNSMFSAFLRHSYKHKTLKNLFYVGGSVHPGGGIPLCLASAAIADREIKPVTTS